MPTTFSSHTYKLQLSAFMLNTASTPITLFDFYGAKRFGRGQHKDRFNHRADFQLLYYKFPGLCRGRSARPGRQTPRFLGLSAGNPAEGNCPLGQRAAGALRSSKLLVSQNPTQQRMPANPEGTHIVSSTRQASEVTSHHCLTASICPLVPVQGIPDASTATVRPVRAYCFQPAKWPQVHTGTIACATIRKVQHMTC